MKVTQVAGGFSPITITIETKAEADALATVLNRSAYLYKDNSPTQKACENVACPLFDRLTNLGAGVLKTASNDSTVG